jgi:hypothetical protein
VSKQRLDLLGTRRRDEVHLDASALEATVRGERALADALGITPEDVSGLRSQARALFDSGKWDRASAVLQGIVALGCSEPEDLVLIAACCERLGDRDGMQTWGIAATEALRRLDALIVEARVRGES